MSDPILELKNIVKSFAEGPVLNGISLAVQPGEFILQIQPGDSIYCSEWFVHQHNVRVQDKCTRKPYPLLLSA